MSRSPGLGSKPEPPSLQSKGVSGFGCPWGPERTRPQPAPQQGSLPRPPRGSFFTCGSWYSISQESPGSTLGGIHGECGRDQRPNWRPNCRMPGLEAEAGGKRGAAAAAAAAAVRGGAFPGLPGHRAASCGFPGLLSRLHSGFLASALMGSPERCRTRPQAWRGDRVEDPKKLL